MLFHLFCHFCCYSQFSPVIRFYRVFATAVHDGLAVVQPAGLAFREGLVGDAEFDALAVVHLHTKLVLGGDEDARLGAHLQLGPGGPAAEGVSGTARVLGLVLGVDAGHDQHLCLALVDQRPLGCLDQLLRALTPST